ncbi:MAG: hypothetical protein U0736_00665 [Gemmataceae bacterium]
MTISIDCPKGGRKARVYLKDGNYLTCVSGDLVALFRAPVVAEVAAASVIKVKIYDGQITPPTDPPAGDPTVCDATITGQSWAVGDVPVPAFTAGQTTRNLTAAAWEVSGGTTVNTVSVAFIGATVGYDDNCCSGSGSGSASLAVRLTGEVGAAELQVTVPDGKHAGVHTARAVAQMAWEARLNGATLRVAVGSCGTLRLSNGGAGSVAGTVEFAPFSAVFPGAAVGAAGDVVVIVA